MTLHFFTTFHRLVLPVTAILLAASAATPARAQADDAAIAKMAQEVSQLTSRQRDISTQLESSLSLKRQHEQQYSALDQESGKLKAESQSIESQRPAVQAACTGTVPQNQLAAAQARCNAVQQPFNRRVNAYNTRNNQLKTSYQAIDGQEKTRVAAAQRLQAAYKQNAERMASLQASIKQAQAEKAARELLGRRNACTQSCASKGGEAASQCLQSCFDGARSDTQVGTVEQNYRPPSGATSNRTPEQAIEEYKNSGRAPGPNTLHTNPVPPPPPSR
jgi:hypothetical protein